MIKVGNISPKLFQNGRAATMERLQSANRIIAQGQTLRSQPAARGPGMSLAEAEKQLARLKARSEKSNQAHRAEMRRLRGDVDDDYVEMAPVDPVVHDIASTFVRCQFAALDRQERFEQRQRVADAMRFAYDRGVNFMFLG